jgi:alpha-tubulin suppressor-like RCC1 family protein
VVAITQGDSHLCALLASGGVSCLGYNATGELGDGTTVGRRTPAPVSGLVSGVTAISAGGDQTCAVTSPGDVFCWGTIDYWSSSPEFKTAVTVPTKVPGLAAVASVSVGTNHTCAVVSGLVKCWGRNDDGQLGDGTFADSATPVTVSGLAANAIAVAAGNRETCALLASGAVACWGAVITDGDGSHSVADSATPVIVTGLAGSPTSLSIGQYSVSAVLPTGGVACWGTDEICNLGQNPCADAIAPVEVVGL